MNAGDLILLFRRQADDEAQPVLWKDDELFPWLSEAEIEACARARLIVDSRSVSGNNTFCRLTLANGTAWYALDPRIIYVRRAKLATRSLPLDSYDYRDLDVNYPGWEAHTGNVIGYVRGLDSGQFRPYKIPTATNTIDLTVVREPLAAMTDPDDVPEIAVRYHLKLLDWVFYRAYSKKDSQAYDPELAGKHLATFEAMFGTRSKATAFEEEWARNNLPSGPEDGNY